MIYSLSPFIIVTLIESIENKRWLNIRLNRAQTLNALTEEMLIELNRLFVSAEVEPSIAGIFLDSVSPKAFCAGGDVKDLINQIESHGSEYIEKFFKTEYSFDHSLYVFSKPFVVFIEGYCFGGGMGISQPADLRIANRAVKLSMPEVFIGLFADVAAHLFLSHLPISLRRFIAMTGAYLDADLSHSFKLIDFIVDSSQKQKILEFLQKHAPRKSEIKNEFATFMQSETSEFKEERHKDLLHEILFLNGDSKYHAENSASHSKEESTENAAVAISPHLAIQKLNSTHFENVWLKASSIDLSNACPYSQLIGYLLFTNWDNESSRIEKISLAFQRESLVARFMASRADFKEGVTKKLILKTKEKCHWSPSELSHEDDSILVKILNKTIITSH